MKRTVSWQGTPLLWAWTLDSDDVVGKNEEEDQNDLKKKKCLKELRELAKREVFWIQAS